MSLLDQIYQKTITENEKNLKFWEDYLNSLKSLDLNFYADHLKIPILVPIGSRIFFPGELKHTNEVTVSLGADYFVKCSLKQAEVLRQHRIKDVEEKVKVFEKEKEYLLSQISFGKQNAHDQGGKEIVEVFTEEEDKMWREQHRENMKMYKQKEAKEKQTDEITDEDLWNKLEELELQEELKNEMWENNDIFDNSKENTIVTDEEELLNYSKEELNENKPRETVSREEEPKNNSHNNEEINVKIKTEFTKGNRTPKQTSKLDLLQQVLDKQNELENKLLELKYREREQSKTEKDIILKLDEMEKLDELEDEIDRLDDILGTRESLTNNIANAKDDSDKQNFIKLDKSISFATDEDEPNVVEITFKHSETQPNNEPYNSHKGIKKPSDIYAAFSHLFDKKSKSILKKSKYVNDVKTEVNEKKQVQFQQDMKIQQEEVPQTEKPIIVKDIVEKTTENQNKTEDTNNRPTSLFKKRRTQSKA